MALIDVDPLIKDGWVLERHGVSNHLLSVKSLADVPTIDPVHAAGGCYCRECEYRGTEDCPMCHEEWIDDEEDGLDFFLSNNATDENGFCSYGRRGESRCEKD